MNKETLSRAKELEKRSWRNFEAKHGQTLESRRDPAEQNIR